MQVQHCIKNTLEQMLENVNITQMILLYKMSEDVKSKY